MAPIPTRKKSGLAGLAWRLSMPVRRLMGAEALDNSVEARLAVSYFLAEMQAAAARTYPSWSKLLDEALSECRLDFDERRALFEMHAIDDYYFAGVVALECARMRGHYDDLEASEILGEVGEQVDVVARRQDRTVSDLVFLILGRIELGAGVDRMKAPHDTVVKAILQQMGLHNSESTRALLRDKALRHLLGEPLALGIPQWWKAFQGQFSLYWPTPEERAAEQPAIEQPSVSTTAEAVVPLRGRRRRRATAF
ncbi:MAG: hypothetical protein AB7E79_09735 [Rhodospirillaceae bacterium]